MPYINEAAREKIQSGDDISFLAPETPGELNYCVVELLNAYIDASGEEVGYSLFNEIMGVLECTKEEFYRRMVAPYEDIKLEENGEVYSLGGDGP